MTRRSINRPSISQPVRATPRDASCAAASRLPVRGRRPVARAVARLFARDAGRRHRRASRRCATLPAGRARRRAGGALPVRWRLAGAAAGAAITLAAVAQVRDPWPAIPAAAAPPVYRCGDSYGNVPCGDAAPLRLGRDPTPAERAQAADVARRERRLADELAAQRRAREALPAPPPVAPRPRTWRDCPPPHPVAAAMASRPSPSTAAGTPPADCPATRRSRTRAHEPAASDTWSIRLPRHR